MTGKFRKVASHYAPEPAFGLFLNLPWGICPLEPRHVNDVSNPAKCPPDIYRNTYGLTRVLPCTHQRGVAPYGIPVHFSRNTVAADKE